MVTVEVKSPVYVLTYTSTPMFSLLEGCLGLWRLGNTPKEDSLKSIKSSAFALASLALDEHDSDKIQTYHSSNRISRQGLATVGLRIRKLQRPHINYKGKLSAVHVEIA